MVFNIYKRGQGKYTRLGSGFGAAIVAALGCFKLYQRLQGSELGLWIETMLPVGVFVVLCFVIFWLANKPTIADFFVSSEGEMKKVSWSSKTEVAVSTFIVIVVVIIMAALLGLTDLGFLFFFDWLGIRPSA
jgi:preprotein translocase SecE subunit